MIVAVRFHPFRGFASGEVPGLTMSNNPIASPTLIKFWICFRMFRISWLTVRSPAGYQ